MELLTITLLPCLPLCSLPTQCEVRRVSPRARTGGGGWGGGLEVPPRVMKMSSVTFSPFEQKFPNSGGGLLRPDPALSCPFRLVQLSPPPLGHSRKGRSPARPFSYCSPSPLWRKGQGWRQTVWAWHTCHSGAPVPPSPARTRDGQSPLHPEATPQLRGP